MKTDETHGNAKKEWSLNAGEIKIGYPTETDKQRQDRSSLKDKILTKTKNELKYNFMR